MRKRLSIIKNNDPTPNLGSPKAEPMQNRPGTGIRLEASKKEPDETHSYDIEINRGLLYAHRSPRAGV